MRGEVDKSKKDFKFGRADSNPLSNYLAKYCLNRKKVAKNILDLGCGYGELIGAFSELGLQTWGVDVSSQVLEAAKFRAKSANIIKIDLVCDRLPFKDKFFDIVTACEVVEHLKDDDNLFGEAYRVIKPGGLFLVTTPTDGSLFGKIFENFVPDDPTHINKHLEKYWTSKITNVGFRVEELRAISFFGFPPLELVRNFFRKFGLPVSVSPVFFPIRTLCSTLFIVARR